MKTPLLSLFVVLGIQTATAQNNIIKGSVQGDGGKLLHYVVVADNKYKTVAFTDSVGDFAIAAHPDSKLLFQIDGYRDTLVDANSFSQNPQINLTSTVSLPISTIQLGLPTAMTADGQVAVVKRNANLVGSRYLFDTFVPGYFTYTDDKKFYNEHCLFNYEKISGFVLLTTDRRNVREVDRDQIKSFTLYDKADQRHDFEQVPAIDKDHYLQVLASGSKYKIYKLIKTSFVSSGVAHTAAGDKGQDFDQYLDEPEYYVLNVETKQLQKITLKKKAIKEAFPKETDKINKFMSENNGNLNDVFLSKLGAVINS